MEVNPYLAPNPEPQRGNGPELRPGTGQPMHWEIGEVINQAWALFKPNWGPLVGSIFVGQMVGGVARLPIQMMMTSGQITPNDDAYWPLLSVSVLIGILVQTFFQAGWMKMWLDTARGKSPNFADAFGGLRRFGPMLLLVLLSTVAILGGTLLFVIPGVILGIGFMFAGWFVVDQNMGAVEAMKASWSATSGQRLKLFGFGIALMGVIILGYLACCIGVMAALPVAQLATGIVYLRVTGQASFDPSDPDQYAPPPGGFSGPPP
jgi:uncharacterized membrane protein